MAGKHRRGAVRAIPAQRSPRPLRITDARTQVQHAVTDESVAQHRHAGRYRAVCGAQVLAASLTAPARGQCQSCAGAR